MTTCARARALADAHASTSSIRIRKRELRREQIVHASELSLALSKAKARMQRLAYACAARLRTTTCAWHVFLASRREHARVYAHLERTTHTVVQTARVQLRAHTCVLVENRSEEIRMKDRVCKCRGWPVDRAWLCRR
eukprot:6192594-Pleurochrysis_carterae.AAC.2